MYRSFIRPCLSALAITTISFVNAGAQDIEARIDSIFATAAKDPSGAAATLLTLRPSAPDTGHIDALMGALYLHAGSVDSTRATLERAIAARPDLAGPPFGMGRVHLELREKPKDAIPFFLKAIEIDSTYADAHSRLAAAYRETDRTRQARRAADTAITLNPRLADPYRILAEIYVEDGNTGAAGIFFKQYLNLNPGDQDTAFEFANSLFEAGAYDALMEIASRLTEPRSLPLLGFALVRQGDHEGALTVYRDYIATLAQEDRALYDDITLVANRPELRAWRSLAPSKKEAFLDRFWMVRDPFKTSGGAFRRAEHYRRVWVARTKYGKRKRPWDRRGEVYIRFGEPNWKSSSRDLNAIVPPAVQTVQNRMAHQLYGDQGTDFSYVGPVYPIKSQRDMGRDLGDSALPGGELLMLDSFKPITSGHDWSAIPWEVWVYTGLGNQGIEIAFTDDFISGNFDYAPIPSMSEEDMERIRNHSIGSPVRFLSLLTDLSPSTRVQDLIIRTPERYDLSFLSPIDFRYEAVSFRGEDGQAELQVSIALPIDEVAMEDDPDTSVVVERRIVLLKNLNEVYRSIDYLGIGISDDTRGRGMLAVDVHRLQTRPGRYELRVQAKRTNTNRTEVFPQALDLPDYWGKDLVMSDLQVAQSVSDANPSSPTRWTRKSFDVIPAPTRQFRKGQPLFIYYEIYNLLRDEFGQTRFQVSYEVQAQTSEGKIKIPFLAKLRKQSGESVGFEFEQTGTAETENDFLEIQLAEAKPGQYEVRMTIQDLNAGTETARQAAFTVIP